MWWATKREDVVVSCEADQLDPEQGARAQVERHARGVGGQLGGRGRISGGQAFERDGSRQVNDLHRHSVALCEPRA